VLLVHTNLRLSVTCVVRHQPRPGRYRDAVATSTSSPDAPGGADAPSDRPGPRLDLLRDPALFFLLTASLIGLILVFAVPRFAGIDEPLHFARAYQVSEGQLMPEDAPEGALEGGGACLPADVVDDLSASVASYWRSLFTAEGVDVPANDVGPPTAPCADGRTFVNFATFVYNPPVPFVPQALAIRVVDTFGGGAGSGLLAGRLAGLATFVALGFVAIRRTPRGQWALVAVALLPITLFQAATLTPDTLTTAAALLVVSSALRMMATKPALRPLLLEAGGLTLFLGLCKPTYAVVALVYLLVIVGRHGERHNWPVLVPLGAAVGVSAGWQRLAQPLFVCDVRFWGVQAAPEEQARRMATHPWELLEIMGRSTWRFGGDWLREVTQIGDRVADWPGLLAVGALALFALVAVQRTGTETLTLSLGERGYLLGVGALGVVAVFAGWIVTCTAVGADTIDPSPRLFLPMLPVVAVALGPDKGRLSTLLRARAPLTWAVLPLLMVFAITVATTMR